MFGGCQINLLFSSEVVFVYSQPEVKENDDG